MMCIVYVRIFDGSTRRHTAAKEYVKIINIILNITARDQFYNLSYGLSVSVCNYGTHVVKP